MNPYYLLVIPAILFYLWLVKKVPSWFWKRLAYASVAFVALLGMYQIKLQREASRTNKAILTNIQNATSKQAQEKQTKLLNFVIDRIDCNSQAQTQRLADQLKTLGIPPEGTITLITKHCADTTGTTTTTTTPH